MADILGLTATLVGKKTTLKFMRDIPSACEKAERYTIHDLAGRVPPIVKREVLKVYNIAGREVKPKTLKTGHYMEGDVERREPGRLRISGKSLITLRFEYTGRLLTPVHFAMAPTSASMNPHTPYVIKMKVFKDRKRTKIGQHLARPPVRPNPYYPMSGYILFPTGAKNGEKTSHIPIQRNLPGHRPHGSDAYSKFETVSMPQMVSSKYTAAEIQEQIAARAENRLSHQLNRVMGI